MFDHVGLRVSDWEASAAFYRQVLGSLRIEPDHADAAILEWDDFSIMRAEPEHPVTRGLHVGFGAADRQAVDTFWREAVAAGYADAGEPGERPEYHPGYYAAYVLDPGGVNVESVHHDRRAQWLAEQAAHG